MEYRISTNKTSSSPQGRIFQVEYAQEAVKQGSVVVGIVSKSHAILAALKVPILPYISTSYMLTSLTTPLASW